MNGLIPVGYLGGGEDKGSLVVESVAQGWCAMCKLHISKRKGSPFGGCTLQLHRNTLSLKPSCEKSAELLFSPILKRVKSVYIHWSLKRVCVTLFRMVLFLQYFCHTAFVFLQGKALMIEILNRFIQNPSAGAPTKTIATTHRLASELFRKAGLFCRAHLSSFLFSPSFIMPLSIIVRLSLSSPYAGVVLQPVHHFQ